MAGNASSGRRRVLCVFVPGIKGSVLRCASCDRRSWPPQFLDYYAQTLRRIVSRRTTKIRRLMDANEAECLVSHRQLPCGVVKSVKVFGGLFRKHVYGTFLDTLRRDFDEVGDAVTLLEFAYDWTLGVRRAAQQLMSDLREVTGSYEAVVFVSHSMGGLVCRYLLEELVHRTRHSDPTAAYLNDATKLLYMVGVPHYGAVRSLHYLVDTADDYKAALSRRMQSLYDMIPFSDLEGERLKRVRSDIFLRKTERLLVVDRDHWKPERPGSRLTDAHIPYLVDLVVSRFPQLTCHRDRLSRAAKVHFALDSGRKRPTGCVYFCVNAVGVKSPSAIETDGRLTRDCDRGDGIVCSVVDERVLWKDRSGWASRLFGRPGIAGVGNTTTTTDRGDGYTSVHLSFINCLDVFGAMKRVLAAELFDNTAVTGPWSGKKSIWWSLVGEGGMSSTEVVSSSTRLFHGCEIAVSNLKCGYCVLSLRTAPSQATRTVERARLEISLVSTGDRLPISVLLKPDKCWTGVTVVLSGHRTISNVHTVG